MNVAIRTLALCAGYGGLELGLAAAFEFVGWQHRVAAYVEREAYAAALLACRMEAGALDEAPIWSDLCTFNARAWRGAVDCVAAGFPCQPHSQAGKRQGVKDARWLWPDIARIVRDSGAWLVILENVPGLLTTGGFDECLGGLAEMGFAAEWGCLPASSVGASHERERIFVVAYAGRQHVDVQQRPQQFHEHSRGYGEMADTSQPRCEGSEQRGTRNGDRGGQKAHGPTSELRRPFFAPGPSDERWPAILADRPDLAPATQPDVRLLADGATACVDEHRAHQLRCGGNGVVPLCAAAAVVELLRRLGIAE